MNVFNKTFYIFRLRRVFALGRFHLGEVSLYLQAYTSAGMSFVSEFFMLYSHPSPFSMFNLSVSSYLHT